MVLLVAQDRISWSSSLGEVTIALDRAARMMG